MPNFVNRWTERALRVPALMVFLTVLGLGAALLFFIAYAAWSLDRSAVDNQTRLIDAAISEKVNRTLMEQKSIAFWDEGAAAAARLPAGTGWLDREFGAYLTEGYGHDMVFVVDARDRLAYGYAMGRRLGKDDWARLQGVVAPVIRAVRFDDPTGLRKRDRLFGLMQERYRYLEGARSARWASHLLKGPDGPVIVSAMTIVPVVDMALGTTPPPLLVSIVRLDGATLALLGESMQIEGLHFQPRGEAPHGMDVPLVADDGRTVGVLDWNAPQPGRPLLRYVLPAFAMILLGAAILTRRMFERLVQGQVSLREQEAHARFLSLHDGLSQLPNRRLFTETLRERLRDLREQPDPDDATQRRICVAYVDLDRFKDINDAIGHGAGDALVMQIAPRLLAEIRPDDMLARLGGDEFAILRTLEGAHDTPEELGQSIISVFKRPFEIEAGSIEITASVGIALAHRGETDPDRVIQDADISLYQSKDLGRNRFTIFHGAMAEEVRLRHAFETELRAAIGSEQIIVHYQPVISARNGAVTGVEALVRWQHPTRGLVGPGRFISLAERSGLMVPLGDHILETVLREARQFGDLQISINLSPVQLRQHTLPDRIGQLCHRFGIAPERICFEVTESMLVESESACGATFEQLCAMGFKTALDDFGTGYSSLGYLHRFRFDKIKIDRSFIASGSLARMRPIIEAIVHIGRGLRMEIVAEGIETEAELAIVRALGCTEAQGYGISRPLALAEMLEFIARPRLETDFQPRALSVVSS